jgi:hypothetical protein
VNPKAAPKKGMACHPAIWLHQTSPTYFAEKQKHHPARTKKTVRVIAAVSSEFEYKLFGYFDTSEVSLPENAKPWSWIKD